MNWYLLLNIADLALMLFIFGVIIVWFVKIFRSGVQLNPPVWVVALWLFAILIWSGVDIIRILNNYFNWI